MLASLALESFCIYPAQAGVSPMNRGEQIRIAIQHRDSARLRGMADETQREEERMFLVLLADIIAMRREGKGLRAA